MSGQAPSSAATRMDRMYRNQRRIYDATRAYYLLGRDQTLRLLKPRPRNSVLEIACGTARNLICAAELYPDARFYGIDVSREMLATARHSIDRSAWTGRIQLAQADATSFDLSALFNLTGVDRILISYALSMIPQWENVIDEALSHLVPGGSLHIIDFGTMDQMSGPARTALRAWLSKFDVTPRDDLVTVCRRLAAEQDLLFQHKQSARGYWQAVVLGG